MLALKQNLYLYQETLKEVQGKYLRQFNDQKLYPYQESVDFGKDLVNIPGQPYMTILLLLQWHPLFQYKP